MKKTLCWCFCKYFLFKAGGKDLKLEKQISAMESYAWFTLLSAFSEQREEAAGLPAAPDIVGAWLSSYSTCTDLKPTYLAAN